MKIVFFGTPAFAAETLRYLLEQHRFNVVAAVTRPDRPQGRSGTPSPSAVKKLIRDNYPSIPILQPEKASQPEFAESLKTFDADLFVVVAYGEIVKQSLLDMPRLGCINLHASLLPKFRGAAPIQRSIIDGETETGVTVMYMNRKMDEGDVIQIAVTPIGPEMTYGELQDELCEIGKIALVDAIASIEKGMAARTPQDHSKATYAPKIELEDCQIDWRRPAIVLHNLVRGVNPEPGAWCSVNIKGQSKRLKVLKTLVRSDLAGEPGTIISGNKKQLVVGCGESALQILSLQLEGKKAMPAEEMLRGIPLESIQFKPNLPPTS